MAAIKHVDKTVPLAAPEGIVLRYGTFYGPGASEPLLDVVRKRQMPVIGGGTGIWSFIEITDAAAATLAAVDRGAPGVYNVVDSDPAPVAEWLPYLAEVAGAKPPLRMPAWLGRLLAGEFVVDQMTNGAGPRTRRQGKSSAGSRGTRAGGRDSVPGSADETGAVGYRPLLFSIAYGMTGSVGDAEDIVQDAFLGLTRARQAGTTIADPKAYLTTAVTRLGINYLSSARVRRETYVGDWLPEPVVVPADGPGPAEHAELADSLSMAFLVLLEALSPVERAVFMLREVFGYGYPEVARITGKTEVNCRQIFARARQRIAAGGQARDSAPPPARRAEGEELARRFFEAAAGGDMDALLGMLAPDVVLHGDGGGKAQAIGKPLAGRQRVMRLLVSGLRRGRTFGASLRLAWVNGQPGAVMYDSEGRVVGVVELDVADGVVQAIRAVANPDKLGHLGPVSEVARLPEN